jgi:predicted transposase YdaD
VTQQRFDPTLKRLAEEYPLEWVEFLAGQVGLPASRRVGVINADVSTVTAASGKVIRVNSREPYILHVELVASHHARLEQNTLLYKVLLGDRLELPVRSVIVLLRPEADRSRFNGVYRREHAGRQYHEFHYDVVRLWQVSPEVLLVGGLGLLPLAPLGSVTREQLPQVIRRVGQRLQAEATPEQAEDLWAATYLLLGLNYDDAFINALLEGVQAMEESSTYQAILRKGEVKGALAEARKILVNIGKEPLGEPDADTLAAINAMTDLAQIEQLIGQVAGATKWSEIVPVQKKRKKRS